MLTVVKYAHSCYRSCDQGSAFTVRSRMTLDGKPGSIIPALCSLQIAGKRGNFIHVVWKNGAVARRSVEGDAKHAEKQYYKLHYHDSPTFPRLSEARTAKQAPQLRESKRGGPPEPVSCFLPVVFFASEACERCTSCTDRCCICPLSCVFPLLS